MRAARGAAELRKPGSRSAGHGGCPQGCRVVDGACFWLGFAGGCRVGSVRWSGDGPPGEGGRCSGGRCSGGRCSGGRCSGGRCSGGRCSGAAAGAVMDAVRVGGHCRSGGRCSGERRFGAARAVRWWTPVGFGVRNSSYGDGPIRGHPQPCRVVDKWVPDPVFRSLLSAGADTLVRGWTPWEGGHCSGGRVLLGRRCAKPPREPGRGAGGRCSGGRCSGRRALLGKTLRKAAERIWLAESAASCQQRARRAGIRHLPQRSHAPDRRLSRSEGQVDPARPASRPGRAGRRPSQSPGLAEPSSRGPSPASGRVDPSLAEPAQLSPASAAATPAWPSRPSSAWPRRPQPGQRGLRPRRSLMLLAWPAGTLLPAPAGPPPAALLRPSPPRPSPAIPAGSTFG